MRLFNIYSNFDRINNNKLEKTMDKQTKVVILSSEQLNNIQMLEKYSQEIELFMKENIPNNPLITIGVIKNVNLINYFQNNGYEITRKPQRSGSLENSNKKLIRDNEIVLFFNYPDSSKITEFIGYVNGLDGKDFRVLELGCK